MLNKDFITNILVIIGVILLQVFVFNHIQILGKYNPFVFIAYIMFMPPMTSFNKILISSFFLGLGLDLFLGTIGFNALCCIVTVLVRQLFLNSVFSKGDASFLQFRDLNGVQILTYIFSISIFYNLLLFGVESFSFKNLLYALKEGLINGLFTFMFIYLLYLLFKNKITA